MLPDEKAVFICGCGHSGTTLIANILAGHPEIYVPLRETGTFLRSERKARKRYRALREEARLNCKPILVEKTPRHISKLDLIRRVVPGARFVVPVRDGRDVVASIKKREGSLEFGMELWLTLNRIVAAERESPDVLVYRHEDFITDTKNQLKRICDFIGIEYTDGLLDFHRRPKLWFGQTEIRHPNGIGRANHFALRNWQINQPIFDSRGCWRSELKNDDVAELTEGAGRDLMQIFGYL